MFAGQQPLQAAEGAAAAVRGYIGHDGYVGGTYAGAVSILKNHKVFEQQRQTLADFGVMDPLVMAMNRFTAE